jgi:hypothetical protein
MGINGRMKWKKPTAQGLEHWFQKHLGAVGWGLFAEITISFLK